MTYSDLKLIEDDELVSNLRESWAYVEECDITAGLNWYREAYAWCAEVAETREIETWQVIALTALFSPQTEWSKNRAMVLSYLAERTANGANGLQLSRASIIMGGENPKLGGYKVEAFYQSILQKGFGPVPCLDSHAFNVLFHCKLKECVKNTLFKSRAMYFLCQQAYIRLASDKCITPQQCQSILWTAEKRVHIASKLQKKEGI